MSGVDRRIVIAAVAIARLRGEWPALSWEDVVALNRSGVFSGRGETREDGGLGLRGVGTGGSRLGRDALRSAWELALGIDTTR